jgi:AraC-like DNA-binding protein
MRPWPRRWPVSEIALTLHFAYARSLIRASRRWNGTTLAHWRTAQKSRRRTVAAPRAMRPAPRAG